MSEDTNGTAVPAAATPAPEATAAPVAVPAPVAPNATTPSPPPTAAPVAAAAPAAPAPVVPAAPAPPADPTWLGARLDQAKRAAEAAVLQELGVTDRAAAKAALEAAKLQEEAGKSAEQRAAEAAAQLKSEREQREKFQSVATEHAARMMGVLSQEQQQAVRAIAGDDAAAQLKAIGVLGPTWEKQAETTAAAQAAATAAAAPILPDANTAPPNNAPNGSVESPPNHRAVYEAARNQNPFAAAAYGRQNRDVYKTP